MYIILDNKDPERPAVTAFFTVKADAVDSFLNLMNGGSMFASSESDVSQFKNCMKLLKEKRYVRGGDYCLQQY